MKKILLSLTSFLIITFSYSQSQTNVAELNRLAKSFQEKWNANRTEVLNYAKSNNIAIRIENDSVTMELQYINEFGSPQYYITENKNAAATVSTNRVNSGGGSGYSLDGSGMTVHEWDGGAVLGTHQEFDSRVTQGDGATTTHYHATHVAGTMIGSGVDANAKGMAPEANLRAFDWNNDESEMASEAATNNSLVSNHSYGYGRGWVWDGSSWSWYGNASVSDQEDYLFGCYDQQAKDWDEIAYNAPYYLIVKSAGNDRGDGPTNPPYPLDGPYDCISHSGLSKNILTVGAVNDVPQGYQQPSDVVMSSFSSWGPVDDGRIKPDIVANGVGLYSATDSGNEDYLSLNGTSMASPNAAGSLILLQEHYEDLNGSGSFMKAATLKALVIHTADEAGTDDGPDYQFGWGLMNTEKAVLKITEDQTNDVISEHTLTDGGTYTETITATSGYPIKVTVVWTDPAPTTLPPSLTLDPTTKMLVNDLDLRITDQSANTFYPWKLDVANPSNPATNTGENDVDNVEVVLIESPTPGETYTITVDHDGTLSSSQDFSMIISGYEVAPVADFSADISVPSINETVTFTDISTNTPTSWTWSISPDTYNFVNGTSATSQNPEIEFTATGYYAITLEAANSGGTGTSQKTDFILASNAPTTYCDAYSTNPAGYIESFHFGTTENNYSGYENIGSADPNDIYYQDFTKTLIDAFVDNTYTLYVLNGYDGASEDLLDLAVWIDFNRDGDFDDTNEQIVCDPDDYGEGTFSVTIPSNAILGYTRMRVRTKYSGSDCGSTCGSTANGEVEDYTLNIRAETLTWQGNVSTDWGDPLNWSNSTIPTSEHNVVIPDASTVTFSPVINAGLNAVCADCSVESGGTLTINGSLTLSLP